MRGATFAAGTGKHPTSATEHSKSEAICTGGDRVNGAASNLDGDASRPQFETALARPVGAFMPLIDCTSSSLIVCRVRSLLHRPRAWLPNQCNTHSSNSICRVFMRHSK